LAVCFIGKFLLFFVGHYADFSNLHMNVYFLEYNYTPS